MSGCSNDIVEQPDREQVPIAFNTTLPSVTVETATRAAFPNSQSLAVVAANATSTTPDWNSLYLDHVATTATGSDAPYSVAFDPTEYWPFDPDKYLSFVAYSPVASSGSRVERVIGTPNTLKVSAGTTNAFPDFIYTVPVGPFNTI